MSVIEALNGYNIPKLSIKWPNDIMSDNKKLGGILIENSIKSDSTIISIVGLGLNINQTNFNNLPNASSLSNVCNSIFDKVEILNRIIEQLKINILNWDDKSTTLKQKYINSLFKKGVPMPFQDNNLLNFMGIIQGVTPIGKLEILLENDTTQEYDIKEIKMLY
jgi:BirA family biotin operon repressor/biotin-[acetyl-CoA-carboxylase] ligase